MKPQYLDQLELERERGITIKMAPVRMLWHPRQMANSEERGVNDSRLALGDLLNSEYILNLIDTPGHSDFAYEVSRALAAVEGAILLVDATQGIQAQTLANFEAAKKTGLRVIGAVNKIDLNPPNLESVALDMARLLECGPEEIYRVSGKTGEGVAELLEAVTNNIPPPDFAAEQDADKCGAIGDNRRNNLRSSAQIAPRALIFDSIYDDHKGAIAFVRVVNGGFSRGEEIKLLATDSVFKIKELGFFSPKLVPFEKLEAGEIGYIATGIKDPDKLKIGDTVISLSAKSQINADGAEINADNIGVNLRRNPRESTFWALPGFKEPKPVVFVSVYPHEDSDYDDLKTALHRLKLNDASFTFEPDMSEVLGRGFKCGFLGRLHFEILTERLRREFGLETINSFPTVEYRVKQKGAWRVIRAPENFPEDYDDAMEPTVRLEILTPKEYLGDILGLQRQFRLSGMTTANFGVDYIIVSANLPLADLISDFDDRLKSVSRGYASFNYEMSEERKADLTKLEILVSGEAIPGLTRIVVSDEADRVGRQMVERLRELLPKQQFAQAIQARAFGRIIARETIPAMKKLLGNFGKTGGDRTRKMKLWKKQQRGKKKLRERGRVTISSAVFQEILKK